MKVIDLMCKDLALILKEGRGVVETCKFKVLGMNPQNPHRGSGFEIEDLMNKFFKIQDLFYPPVLEGGVSKFPLKVLI